MIVVQELMSVMEKVMYQESELTPGQTEPPEGSVLVEGVVRKFAFHPGRLEYYKRKVIEWLNELPKGFHMGSGDGSSFLGACMDKDGHQWGEHIHIEMLICMGMGLGLVQWCLPRDTWNAFPGGMPYFQVDTVNGFSKA